MKKTISVILSVLMTVTAFSAVPFSARAEDVVTISSYSELKAYSDNYDHYDSNARIVLTDNIVCTDSEWEPVLSLRGIFDGNNYSIKGLAVPEGYGDRAGLFKTVAYGACVQNLTIEDCNIGGRYNVGAIAAENEGTIKNCCNKASVFTSYNNSYAGGIAGENKGTIENCYNSGTITANSNLGYGGGIAGGNYGTITGCYNTGRIKTTGETFEYVGAKTGGIAGYNHAYNAYSPIITDCYNAGEISGNEETGGIVGMSDPGTVVEYCYNTGKVFAEGAGVFIGGIAGDTRGSVRYCYNDEEVSSDKNTTYLGGIAGFMSSSGGNYAGRIEYCRNSGALSLSGGASYIGGILGSNGSLVSNSYNTGNITVAATIGSSVAGGVAGKNSYGKVDSCYSCGLISKNSEGNFTIGGVVGSNGSLATNSCYDRRALKIEGASADNDWLAIGSNGTDATVSNVTGRDTAEMTGSYALTNMGFTDVSVWMTKTDGTDEESGRFYWYYPHLRGFDFDESGAPKTAKDIEPSDWPAKTEVSVNWNEPDSFVYDKTDKALKPIAAVGGKALDKSEYGTSLSVKNGDSYEITDSAVNAGKYKAGVLFLTPGHIVIEKKFEVTPKKLSVTAFSMESNYAYNGREQTHTGVVQCTDTEGFDASKFSYTGNTTIKATNAGTHTLELSKENCVYNDSNYDVEFSIGSPIEMDIAPSVINITAENKETNHGSDLTALTYTIKNFHGCYYNPDELGITLSTNANKNKAGTYDITVSYQENTNYVVNTINGTYTVGGSPHTWSDTAYEWTELESVKATRNCIYCDETETETADVNSEQTKAPTCTEKGETTYTAEFTNPVFSTQTKTVANIDSLGGHKYGTEGDERFTCTVCGAVDEALKAEAEKSDKAAADKAAAEAKAAKEKAQSEFAAGVKITPEDDGATVEWTKTPEAKRYVIYAAYCGRKKYKKIKTVKGNITSFRLKKLRGKKIDTKKNIKVYIVAQKNVNGKYKKLFKTPTFHVAGKKSRNTNIKKIKVKKAKFTLTKGKTAKIKATPVPESKKKKPINHVRKLRYMSTNTAVVKVSKGGKLKAVGKGTATVYVFSNNGTPKAVKVTVE